ncbi:beta-glucosidase-like SFR2, chloroplastic isoform X2 [Tanacetum coccineum]
MAPIPLFVTATKLAGVLVTISFAANAVSFSRYRKRNLAPFESPIDETNDTLAVFNVNPDSDDDDGFEVTGGNYNLSHFEKEEEESFFFGLATAPAHVEDRLDDAWLQFAQNETDSKQDSTMETETTSAILGSATAEGGSQLSPARLKKKTSLRIAMEAKIRGIVKYIEDDDSSSSSSEEETAIMIAHAQVQNPLERYRWIIGRVQSYGMKVMLTLFHHSLPPWAGEYGGWKLEKTVNYFMDFTRLVVDNLFELVDYWVTFNEPHVFCMLTYCAGAWPGGHPDMLEAATSALPTGVFYQCMHWIAVAHNQAYDYIHEQSVLLNPIVGVAHHVSFMRPYGLFDVAGVSLANSMSLFPFLDDIAEKMDYIGLNYYGQEVICGTALKLVESDEYSESGRGVYPDGLFRLLLHYHERYKHLKIPFIITENGISDETDLIRKPYIIEHLLAIYGAMMMGVRVLGYLFWTTSDNWEWADGYGPKFGLVAVDRFNDLARVVTSGKITRQDRDKAFYELQKAAREKKTRPFYRAVNKYGLMYSGGLDEPIMRPYVERDWRFGHYEMEGLQDPFSRFSRFITRLIPLRRRKKAENREEYDELMVQPV